MNYSSEIVNQVKDLLIISGVPKGEILEEMIDHYLSEVDSKIDKNISPQIAIRSCLQNIARTDFSYLVKKEKSIIPFVLTSIILLLLTIGVCLNHSIFKASPSYQIAENMDAPKGWPLKESTRGVTSNFGMRIHPISKISMLHKGVDLKAKTGDLVFATGRGTIEKIGFSENAGNFIIVKHNSRFSSRFNHLSKIQVKENEKVFEGDVIGKVGSSGMSRGPHLHYEIMDEKVHIDPLVFATP